MTVLDGQAEEARDRVVRVHPAARPERVDAAPGQGAEEAEGGGGVPRDEAPSRSSRPRCRRSRSSSPRPARPPGLKTGTRVRSCTVPPSASLPYSALEGPRTTSIPSSASGSTMSKNVLMPPRWAEVV